MRCTFVLLCTYCQSNSSRAATNFRVEAVGQPVGNLRHWLREEGTSREVGRQSGWDRFIGGADHAARQRVLEVDRRLAPPGTRNDLLV